MNGVHQALEVVICEDAADAVSRGFDYAKQGRVAPIQIEKVVVVRKGTQSGNPTVDFLLVNEKGERFVFMVTGALIKAIPCGEEA